MLFNMEGSSDLGSNQQRKRDTVGDCRLSLRKHALLSMRACGVSARPYQMKADNGIFNPTSPNPYEPKKADKQ